jgi:hypothetical protein
MNVRTFFFLAFALGLLSLAGFAQSARASARAIDHGGVYVGDVYVERGQVVNGDITVIGGDATVFGAVRGDLDVVGGNIWQAPGSTVTGQTNVLGGQRSFVAPYDGDLPAESSFLTDAHVFWKIGWSAVVLLMFLIFPLRTRMALDRLEKHPGLCAAIGVVGWVAVIPVALLLCVTLILIPLIVVEGIAIVAGVFIGKAALSLLVGRRFYEMLSPRSTATPLIALVLGLVLITAAELVPIVGTLVSALVGLVGLGAAILAFVREEAFTGMTTPAAPVSPTIGGPPMVIG